MNSSLAVILLANFLALVYASGDFRCQHFVEGYCTTKCRQIETQTGITLSLPDIFRQDMENYNTRRFLSLCFGEDVFLPQVMPRNCQDHCYRTLVAIAQEETAGKVNYSVKIYCLI